MTRARVILPLLIAAVVGALPATALPDAPVAAICKAVQAGECDAALAQAKAFARQHPEHPEIASMLAQAASTATHEKRLELTIEFLKLLLETCPDAKQAVDARAELVACYSSLRQLDNCIAQAGTNLALDPDSRWVEYWRFLIAQSHYKQWKFGEAKAELEALLGDYPDGEYTDYTKAYLGRINPSWELDEHGVVPYTGKYEQDIRFQAALKQLPDCMDLGFDTLKKRLGVDLRPYANVVYRFTDAGNRKGGGLKATTRMICLNDKPTVMIRFYTEYVAVNPVLYRRTIVHEMKHAGFRGVMGQAYDELPQWIVEGLALWGTYDIDPRMQKVLCNEIVAGRDPMAVIDGIEDRDHTHRDYMEDALAFEWLAIKNPDNVRRFCRRLVRGEPYRAIWTDLCGMPYEEAMKQADAYCRRRVKDALGEAYAAFASLRKADADARKQGDEAIGTWLRHGGEAKFRAWLDANPGHPAEPFARFCLARSLITAGEHDAGRKLLRHILEHDADRCTLLDDAQYWIGVSYNRQNDVPNYRNAFGVLLRDFSYSSSAKQLIGKLPPAGPVTE